MSTRAKSPDRVSCYRPCPIAQEWRIISLDLSDFHGRGVKLRCFDDDAEPIGVTTIWPRCLIKNLANRVIDCDVEKTFRRDRIPFKGITVQRSDHGDEMHADQRYVESPE